MSAFGGKADIAINSVASENVMSQKFAVTLPIAGVYRVKHSFLADGDARVFVLTRNDIRFWPLADIPKMPINVRFRGKS